MHSLGSHFRDSHCSVPITAHSFPPQCSSWAGALWVISGQIVQINTHCCQLCNHVCISFYWLWMYSSCSKISKGDGFKRTHTVIFVSRFVVSYSAGCHGGAAKVRPDLSTAECTLQCVSYYNMCLINMAGHIFTTRKNLPLWCNHLC